MSWLHVHCATLWPEVRHGGMAYLVDPEPSVDPMPVVDMSAHRKVYVTSWCVTYDVFCTIANLPPREQLRRLRVLGIPKDNPGVVRI